MEQWATLLDQVVSSPELAISRLTLVTANSKALLPDPAATLDDKWEGAIHEVLAKQARRSPDSLALADPTESWSYRELDEASDRLATALIAAGIKPKDRVAIYAERNSSLVVAIFGILKSGAAFLILDPAYPRLERSTTWISRDRKGGCSSRAAAPCQKICSSCLDQSGSILPHDNPRGKSRACYTDLPGIR